MLSLPVAPEWRARIAKGAAVAVALVAAFAGGTAFRRPPETKTVERVVYKDRVVEKRVEVKVEAERKVVYRDRVVKPDGTRVEREVERTDTDTRTGETVVRTEEHDGKRVTEVTVSSAPRWHVSVLAGAQLSFQPLGASPAFGAAVNYRIAGPFTVGAWGLSSGAGGLSVGVAF